MTRRIVERFSPLKVLIFGSRARGDHRPDSDIDLIVDFSAIEHHRQLAVEIRKAVSCLGFAKDILVATPMKQNSPQLYSAMCFIVQFPNRGFCMTLRSKEDWTAEWLKIAKQDFDAAYELSKNQSLINATAWHLQ